MLEGKRAGDLEDTHQQWLLRMYGFWPLLPEMQRLQQELRGLTVANLARLIRFLSVTVGLSSSLQFDFEMSQTLIFPHSSDTLECQSCNRFQEE